MTRDILIGSDHAGYQLKVELLKEVWENWDFQDCGTHSMDPVDYPDIAHAVCQQVIDTDQRAVLVCGTGIGMTMVANRYPEIRAALCYNEEMARMARKHNNANVLVLGKRMIAIWEARNIIRKFLTTDFEAGRHSKRIAKFNQ